jgi:hypothetical protein
MKLSLKPHGIEDSIIKLKIIKIYFIVVFCIITFSTVLAWENPAHNFEISIYSGTPFLFWFCMCLVLMLSIILLLLSLYYNKMIPNKSTYLCLMSIFLCYILINSLFIIRGYYMWNMSGDGATHLGWAKSIILSGHIPENLFYPFIHVFLAVLVYIPNLDLVFLHKIVPLLFAILFVPFMFIFARYNFPKKNAAPVLVALLSCSFLLPSTLLGPNQNSNMIFPFLLTVYCMNFTIKKKKAEYKILLLICLFFITVFHPISAFTFGLIVLSVYLSLLISSKYSSVDFKSFMKDDMHLYILILLIIFFIQWLIQFAIFKTTIHNMYYYLIQIGENQYSVMPQAIENANHFGQNYIVEIFKRFGKYILVIFFSYIDIFSLYKHSRFSRNCQNLILFSFSFTAITLFTILIISAMGFSMAMRWLDYVLILGIIFCSHLIFNLLNYSVKKISSFSSKAVLLTIGIVFTLMILGVLDIYPSPYNEKGSYHSTEMSIRGMEFFFDHRNTQVSLIGITTAPGRYADLLLSPEEKKKQNLPDYMYMTQIYGTVDYRPPFHFGYNNNSSLGNYYNQETDMITNREDIEYYSVTRPELASLYWNFDDFHKLMDDPKVNEIYSNSEYTIWKIIP